MELETLSFVYMMELKEYLKKLGLNEFEKKGYMFKGEQGMLKVMRGSMVVMKDVRKDNLYGLECCSIWLTVYY